MSLGRRKSILIWAVSLLAFLLALFVVLFFPFFTAPGKGSFVEKLRRDNATVSGTITAVIGVGPLGVGKRPLIVDYEYVGFSSKQTGRVWFEGEQTVPVTDAKKFKSGRKILVEYSRVRPGLSCIKGYGTGSVYIYAMKELLWFYLSRAVWFMPGLFSMGLGIRNIRRASIKRKKKSAALK